jgi:hypothetical protein
MSKGIAPILLAVIVVGILGGGFAIYKSGVVKQTIIGEANYDKILVKTSDVTISYTCPLTYTDIYGNVKTVMACRIVISGSCSYSGVMTCGNHDLNVGETYNDIGYAPSAHHEIYVFVLKSIVCGDSIISTGEICDPPNQIVSLGSSSYKYCSLDCTSWVTVNCNDNNPCTTDILDSTTIQCKHTTIVSGSIGTGSDANNCGGNAQESCKFYQCSNGQCVKGDLNNVAQAGKCEGTYWCVSGSCTTNPSVQCLSDNDCPTQSYECKAGCINNQMCTYPTSSISPKEKCVGNSCQPYTNTQLNSLCGATTCSAAKSCGAQCDSQNPCTVQTINCPASYCDGVKKCSYAKSTVSGTPTCANGICSTLNLACGTPTCVNDITCGACTQDKSCGDCGIQKCVSGVLQPCEPIQNSCGGGYTCQ